jgi:hypothetical protein
MEARRFALYFSWSRSKEMAADLGTLEGRFPALFGLKMRRRDGFDICDSGL